MASKKRAFQSYYRDSRGELRVQLYDLATGQPVKNPSEYQVIDLTDLDAERLGVPIPGAPDAPKTKTAKAPTAPTLKDLSKGDPNRKKHGTGDKRNGEGSASSGRAGASRNFGNKFGWIEKPKLLGLAGTAAGLINPLAGAAVKAAGVGINLNNIESKNAARKALGLEAKDQSFFEKAKEAIRGPDDMLGETSIGKNKYGVSLTGRQTKDNKGTLTPSEMTRRRDALAKQEDLEKGGVKYSLPSAADMKANTSKALAKADSTATKTSSTQHRPAPGDYRTPLAQVNFDEVDVAPDMRNILKDFQSQSVEAGLNLGIDLGSITRTPAEQRGIKSRGTSPTTKSYHMANIAADISPLDATEANGWNSPQSPAMYSIAENVGLVDGRSFGDDFHFQLSQPGETQAAGFLSRHKADIDYFGDPVFSREERERLGLPDTNIPTDRPLNALGAPSVRSTNTRAGWYREQYALAKEAGLTGLQADLAVSQAAIESGYGTGKLASTANNLHSIKAGETWTGPTASFMDDEPGPSSFRQYASPVDSYKDWAKVMETNFPNVLTATSLPEAIEGLKNGVKGMYATSFLNPNPEENYATHLTKAYNDFVGTGINKETTDPASMVNPNATDFEKYSTSFYKALQDQPDVSKTVGPTADMGRMDTPSSGRATGSFGSNRPATMGMGTPGSSPGGGWNSQRSSSGSNRPTAGQSVLGGGSANTGNKNTGGSFFGGNKTSGTPGSSPGGGWSTQGSGGGYTGGGPTSGPSTGKSFSGGNSPSEGGSRFGGLGLGTPDKDKDKDNEGATGQYGSSSFGGPR